MKTKQIILVCCFFALFSCKKEKATSPTVTMLIYKFKGEYINKSSIELTNDKSNIRSIPIEQDTSTKNITFLKNGYILEVATYIKSDNENRIVSSHTRGVYSAYLNINRKDWLKASFNSDSLKAHIIDNDPFIEFYMLKGDPSITDTSWSNIDDVIANGELVTKRGFIKLK